MVHKNYWEQTRDFTDLEWDNIKKGVEYLKEVGYDVMIHSVYFDNGGTDVVTIYGNSKHNEKFSLYKEPRTDMFSCTTRMTNYDIAVKYMLARAKAELGNDFSYSFN